MQFVQTTPGADPIVVESYFAASPEQVFFAWTNADEVMQWFGPKPRSLHSAHIDLREGGAWRFVESDNDQHSIYFEGRYLKIIDNALLLFSWSKVVHQADGTPQASPTSQVEIHFTACKQGTQIRLIHSAMHDLATRRGFCQGWERAFNHLKHCLELR